MKSALTVSLSITKNDEINDLVKLIYNEFLKVIESPTSINNTLIVKGNSNPFTWLVLLIYTELDSLHFVSTPIVDFHFNSCII